MVDRKVYKTKLCVLHQRGRCHRQTCSFAHGNAELRRVSNFGPERRDFRGRDLREKLDRRHSPVGRYSSDRRHSPVGRYSSDRRHSPVGRYSSDRDARERHASRAHSSTDSAGRNDRSRRMKHHSDGQSDISGSLNMSDGSGDHVKEKKHLSSNSKDVLKLRQLQSEINLLDEQKRELEIYLEETTCQAESLSSKIQDLEMELFKEKDECKRITSKMKKFIEAYNNHSRLEGELKRSEAQLQKLANKLSSDFVRTGASGEDSAINIIDGGMAGNHFSSLNEQQKDTSPTKKRPRIYREADETSNQASTKGKGNASQRIAYPFQLNNEKKDEAEFNSENAYKTLVGEEKIKKGINFSSDMSLTNKPKASDIAVVLPSTSMAAHAADEDVEVVDMEDKLEVAGKGTPSGIPEYPFLPPPPPLPPGACLQYSRDDAYGVDEEMLEVDVV
ncbi:putative traB domain-containing protein-like [Capsicum annuum]|uniref:zinc finger CCCH domain-containing protein 13 isoform X2 n=1 Tax=Capsicum annuum TaxID=4072 RepID=UPI0007BF8481|nr:zinc finger CCCH domain-containing protein 13 isoform X2 [Capsicum annuum]KAF3628084.1 putative traB domain-containing protein-like [Capsicum annuum]KAF3632658.1 putative traB domain-containing protein-like [Capsicum annuum]